MCGTIKKKLPKKNEILIPIVVYSLFDNTLKKLNETCNIHNETLITIYESKFLKLLVICIQRTFLSMFLLSERKSISSFAKNIL